MRYTKEVRFRFVGDPEKCKRYIPQARTILGGLENRGRTLGGLDIAFHKTTLPDGTVIMANANDTMPILTIIVQGGEEESVPTGNLLLTTWEPRGLLLTPKTVDAPDGWGLPLRDVLTGSLPEIDEEAPPNAPTGTLGGSLPQVLLNRYPNNRHFDNPLFLAGEIPPVMLAVPEDYTDFRRRHGYEVGFDAYGIMHIAWLLHPAPSSYAWPQEPDAYFDTNEEPVPPGIYSGRFNEFLGAFVADSLSIPQGELDEVTTEEWHTHRAEDLLYYSATQEGVFLRTNEARAAVGEEPLYRPVRGDCDPSMISALNAGQSETHSFTHSHPDFAPGYRTAGGRTANAVGYTVGAAASDNPVENMQAYTAGSMADPMGSIELGTALAEVWIASPPHYAAIINSDWTAREEDPWHSWAPLGTRGASMYIQFYAPTSFDTKWIQSDGTTWATENISMPGAVAWEQTFVARESWLPAYDKVVKYTQGLIGLFCGGNPLSGDFAETARFGIGRTVYEMPEHMYKPRDRDADFLCIAGVAPFLRGGVTWLRIAYWESSDQLETPLPPVAEYLTLRVALIPASLCEAGNLPWRYALPPVWEPEFTHTFSHAAGYMSLPENHMHFNSEGTSFVFEVGVIDTRYTARGVVDGSGGAFTLDATTAMTYPAGALTREAYKFTAATETDSIKFVRLIPEQTPLVASVAASSSVYQDSEGYDLHSYERTLRGQYKIWPHFDSEDAVQFVILDVDEYQIQRGNKYEFEGDLVNPGDAFEDHIYDNTSTGRPWYGWRIRKMIFPIPPGETEQKEVLYMQQYVWQYRSVEFNPALRLPVYNVFPGTGENFYMVVHHIDIPTASMIYSKHGSVMTRMPSPANKASWYLTGDNDYYLDAVLGGVRVQQQFAHYPKPTVDELRPYLQLSGGSYRWKQDVVHDYPVTIYNRSYLDIYRTWTRLLLVQDLYNFGTSPAAVRHMVSFGAGSGTGGSYATQAFTTGKSAPLPGNGSFSNIVNTPASCYFDFIPVDDYVVSCFSGYDYVGETSTSMKWVERAAAGRTAYCGFWHNIMPLFSKSAMHTYEEAGEEKRVLWHEVSAKFAEHDGRWVARLQIRHLNNGGLAPPDPWYKEFPASTPPNQVLRDVEEWTYRPPSDRITSWAGRDDLTDSMVHLLANFDIDTAVGMSDVVDVEPFGRVG